MIKSLGTANNFSVDTSTSAAAFSESNLAKYAAVIFLNSGGDTTALGFHAPQRAALQKFIRDGKGYVGTHSADNTLNNWQWYHDMLGSTYINDFWVDNAKFYVIDTNHASTKGLPNPWYASQQLRKNVWLFNDSTPGFRVLVKADNAPYDMNPKPAFLPYVYTHEFEGGRVWYGGMGHASNTFTSDMNMRKCILGGILYALGRPGASGTTGVLRQQTGFYATCSGRAGPETVHRFILQTPAVNRAGGFDFVNLLGRTAGPFPGDGADGKPTPGRGIYLSRFSAH